MSADTIQTKEPIARLPGGDKPRHAAPLPRADTLASWSEHLAYAVTLQIPWLLALAVIAALVASPQGAALAAVDRPPWWAQLFAMVSMGLAVASSVLAALSHAASHGGKGARSFELCATLSVAWLSIGSLALSYAIGRGNGFGSWLFLGVTIAALVCGTRLFLKEMREPRWAVASRMAKTGVVAGVLVLSLLLLVAGYAATSYATEWVTALGTLTVAFVALSLLAVFVQTLLLSMPTALGSVGYCFLFAVALATAHVFEPSLPDRVNPLMPSALAALPAKSDVTCGVDTAQAAPRLSEAQLASLASLDAPLAISAEGGGIRAAYWTARSLEALSQAYGKPLIDRVVLLSGVSGGSLGIATWLAAQELPQAQRLACIHAFLADDFLTPLVAGLLFVDAPRLILPASIASTHRGDYFERALAERWYRLTGSKFFFQKMAALRRPGMNATQPIVAFNATDALTGAFVALDNQGASQTDWHAPNTLNGEIQKALEGMTVAQAVHTSARFTYVSPAPDLFAAVDVVKALKRNGWAVASAASGAPQAGDAVAGKLDTQARARIAALVDGGYFDNSGLVPVFQYVRQWAARRAAGGVKDTAGELTVLHIGNDQTAACASQSSSPLCQAWLDKQMSEAQGRGLMAWITRPAEAVINVRDENTRRRQEELALLANSIGGAVHQRVLQLGVPTGEKDGCRREGSGAVPLGWRLAEVDVAFMDCMAARMPATLASAANSALEARP